MSGAQLTDTAPWGGGTLGDALLAPTVLYVRPVLQLIQQLPVKVWMPSCHTISLAGGSCQQTCMRLCRHAIQPSQMQAGCCQGDSMCAMQGLVHMTGGGFPENIPRVVPKGLQTRIDRSAWEVPELFRWLQKVGLSVCRSRRICSALRGR